MKKTGLIAALPPQRHRKWQPGDASGGSICNKKKHRLCPPHHPDLICLGRTQTEWRGFSSYGHRLSSLYRNPTKPPLTLTGGYQINEPPASSRSKYSNSTPSTYATGEIQS